MILKLIRSSLKCQRSLSTWSEKSLCYKLLIVGGGSGGLTMAAIFARLLGKGKVAVLEPQKDHYYQPLWTLVGGGLKKVEESRRQMERLVPKNAQWIPERAVQFDPVNNVVYTNKERQVRYEFLIVAMGLALHFEKIKGLPAAFETPGVCSNYSWKTVDKTQTAIKSFSGGNAIFTQPSGIIKCAGAPQKAMYLAEAFFRQAGLRDRTNMFFNIGSPVIFSAPVYAEALYRIIQEKGIHLKLRHNLVEIKPETKEAEFEVFQTEGTEKKTFPYDLLHVVPPMGAPEELRKSILVDSNGYLDVDRETLQHKTYKNVFGIGDCTNLPTSKTAAAAASQSGILKKNLKSLMDGKPLTSKYDGYTSCPLVTSYGTAILAEFDYQLNPLETLPIDQSKERWICYRLKKDLMAPIYWNLMLKGYWHGPKFVRKLLHLGFGK